ncbi:MAG: pilus assembly protein [Burkholderiales bacterium PBB4]|nr:MAG: pilus assembly protein [Burkholderiales bacterium PBB4]
MTKTLISPAFWRDRLKASAIHLGISLTIAAIAAGLVFGVWYPYPYSEISGGRELFILIVSVDVILGPLITLAVFNRTKPWKELRRDLACVGLLQMAALAYGLWTVAVARPVHLVFEIDRFRVVHAIEVEKESIANAPSGVNAMPWTGPTTLSLRPFKDNQESMDKTLAALEGAHLGARPELWQPYAAGAPDVLRVAKPVAVLKSRFPQQATAIDAVLEKASKSPQTLRYVPLVGRKLFWTAFVDPVTAEVVATMPLDSF